MKTVVIAGLAVIAFASLTTLASADPTIAPGPFAPPPAFPAAHATQGPTVTPGPLDPPPAYPTTKLYNWTGFYVGANGGATFGSTRWSSVPDLVNGSFNTSSGLIGGTGGYNLQTGDALVLGIEADLGWSNISGTVSPTTAPMACGTPGPGPCSFKIPWLGTTRLRVGYAFNGILPYITGGAAIAELDATQSGAGFGTAINYNLGWTAGAGVEVAITETLRAKVEYLHVNLNGFSCYGPCGAQITGGPISFNATTNVVRAGLNYRFGN